MSIPLYTGKVQIAVIITDRNRVWKRELALLFSTFFPLLFDTQSVVSLQPVKSAAVDNVN